ncbi:MAG: putative porin, partial [Methylococcales bacterium]
GKKTLVAVLASAMVAPAVAVAGEKEELQQLKSEIANERKELLKLKNTAVSLIDVFVQQGMLDKSKADSLIKAAEAKAGKEAEQHVVDQAAQEQPALPATNVDVNGKAEQAKPGKSIQVAYVPEFVKDEIREQVRAELKEDVLKDVKADAKAEKWGIPAALPEWLNKIKISGDVRFRGQDDFYGPDNPGQLVGQNPYLDYLAINKEGGRIAARNKNEELLNTSKDRLSIRERVRLGIDAQITDDLKAGFRLATSNISSPVSIDQKLGNTGQSFDFVIDRAFLQYDYLPANDNKSFSLYGGRIINPWMSTDLVYDQDLSFEGFAGTFRLGFNQDDPALKAYQAPPVTSQSRAGVNLGPQTPNSIFATLGVFPIQEINLSTSDKWLFGGQLGADWLVRKDSRLKVAAAYYDYDNVRARPNADGRFQNDWTAPQFIQKGNSMVPINVNQGNDAAGNPINARCTDSQSGRGEGCLYGLASDFKILNVNAIYDYAGFKPVHVMLSMDYAKNFGFDAARINKDFNGALSGEQNADKSSAYQVRLDVGAEQVSRFKDWSAFIAYRYIERDAVLDAFNDSVFHLGGTNAKGWVIGASYGLAKNTFLQFRWLSSDVIDPLQGRDNNGNTVYLPFSVDSAVLDLNASF